MKTKGSSAILLTLALGVFGATAATAQHETHSGAQGAPKAATDSKHEMSHDQMMMAKEPHHVLAMAYHQNMVVFARAMQNQSASGGAVDLAFSRTAVTEMRRSFEQMSQHHQEHMKTMDAAMQAKMSGMMQQMETHRTELNTQLTALEQEVQLAAPDAKKVAALAASVHAHLDAMPMMMQGNMGSRMKAKM